MFAGKTSALLRNITREKRRRRKVLAVTHRLDDRFGVGLIASHDRLSVDAVALGGAEELREHFFAASARPDVVALDEAQFFGPGLSPVVAEILRAGTDVDVAGLCQDHGGHPFEPVATLMTQAEDVIKLVATCAICGAAAVHQQLIDDRPAPPGRSSAERNSTSPAAAPISPGCTARPARSAPH
ncbi:thymidine kinase [Corynebacterium maris DSM 45190]|uniref:Thymidine kinase n=2 Tax=Corynebacterium TaxID=1716 RepID=S5TIC4_9CORY|nr:thymidine kinase [Corynebacterium maris DSM 45190]